MPKVVVIILLNQLVSQNVPLLKTWPLVHGITLKTLTMAQKKQETGLRRQASNIGAKTESLLM